MIQGAIGNIILIGLWYAILFLFVPAICLHHVVREKRLVFRLAFYQIAGLTNLAFWGYLFAYFKVWPVWALRIVLVFLPIILKLILDRKRLFSPAIEQLKELSAGRTGSHILRKKIGLWLKEKCRRFYEYYIKNKFVQILILLALAAFVVWYYGYFKLHFTTYATSDEATHLYWVHALMTDQAFPGGLYPHLMHFIIATISPLLRISALYVNHYLSVIMILQIHFVLFCVIKTIVRSKSAAVFGTGLFVLANIFVTGDRYQMTLPMEFGFIPMLLVILFLHSYWKDKDKASWWMIILSLFCAAQIHLTSAVFALFFVLAYLIVFMRPKQKLKTLAAVLLALVISVLPFAAGLLAGYQMEQSLGWAVSLLENRDDYYEGNEVSEHTADAGDAKEEEVRELTDTQKEWKQVKDLPSFNRYVVHLLTEDVVLSETLSVLLYILELFAILYGIFRLIVCRKKEKKDGIIIIPVIWLIVFLSHAIPKTLGSTLTDSGRMQILLCLVSAMLFAVPVQAVSDLLAMLPKAKKWSENVMLAAAALSLGAFYLFGPVKDIHNLRYNFVIQSESFKLTDDVINNNKKDTWTVISPVNDLVGIRCYGYHYEIIDLLWQIEGGEKEFYIPTPDIYVVVEKRVPHFSPGETTFGLMTAECGADLIHDRSDLPDPSFVDASFDSIGLTAENKAQKAYYDYRLPTMSKLKAWMETVKNTYPGEVSVVSEDENCIIYHITQDPYFLLNLALDYRKGAS